MNEIISGFELDEKNSEKFRRYYELLIEWNEKINLTAITDEKDVYTKHFADCLHIFDCGKIKDGDKIIDVGTGAGFPGIPMKIINDSLNVTLLDSLNKRISFLNEVINKIDLTDIEAVHFRAEDAGCDISYREKYDVCVSRAVANLSTLSELCLPFVKKGGYFISMKGPSAQDEADSAKNAIKALGGKLEEIQGYEILGTDLKHCLVIIKKVSDTRSKYPRKAPKPLKDPIK